MLLDVIIRDMSCQLQNIFHSIFFMNKLIIHFLGFKKGDFIQLDFVFVRIPSKPVEKGNMCIKMCIVVTLQGYRKPPDIS